MPFGMPFPGGPTSTNPYEQEDEYGMAPPMGQAQQMGLMPPPMGGEEGPLPGDTSSAYAQSLQQPNTPVPQQLNSAPLMGGEKGPSKASKWMDTLAPILAGAAAVLGYKKDSIGGDVLMGVGKGYADYLTNEAKMKAQQEQESSMKTIDLAHKYLGEMPGDVDAAKYPRLGEMGTKMREMLVNGKLSSPKDAQNFILEYTKYKNDIEQLKQDEKKQELDLAAQAPFDAFKRNFEGMRGTDMMGPFMAKNGGLVQDPLSQEWVHPSVLNARERVKQDIEEMKRKEEADRADRDFRANEGQKDRDASAGRVRMQEEGRDRRFKRKGASAGTGTKEYDGAFKAARAHALQKAKMTGLDSNMDKDTYEYMFTAGHLVPIKGRDGKTGYYIGNGQVTTDKKKAESMMMGRKSTMAPPPISLEEDEEDPEAYE